MAPGCYNCWDGEAAHRPRIPGWQVFWNAYMAWLNQAPPELRHQRLHDSHYSFVDPEEARFISPDLIKATCLTGTPEELVEQLQRLAQQGLKRVMLYPPLNRPYRVIEDFATQVMARL